MRIFVTTDIHANILAAERALALETQLSPDIHIHMGDSVDLGPWPEDTFQLLRDRGVLLLMGNHEENHCSIGIGPVVSNRMDAAEAAHYAWTRSRLSDESIESMERLPYSHTVEDHGIRLHFQHFPIEDGRIAERFRDATPANLEGTFECLDADIYYFGHIHRKVDVRSDLTIGNGGTPGSGAVSRAPRYICPGATGVVADIGSGMSAHCVDITRSGCRITPHSLDWDIHRVRKAVRETNRHNRDWLLANVFKVVS